MNHSLSLDIIILKLDHLVLTNIYEHTTQATSLNCVQLKQSANWCSLFTQNDLKKNKKTNHFQENKWAEYAKVQKMIKKK